MTYDVYFLTKKQRNVIIFVLQEYMGVLAGLGGCVVFKRSKKVEEAIIFFALEAFLSSKAN